MKNIMFSIAGFGAIAAGYIGANLLWILVSRIKAEKVVYSVAKVGGKLVAYRRDGEQAIDTNKIVL
jgi:hypothetical protein